MVVVSSRSLVRREQVTVSKMARDDHCRDAYTTRPPVKQITQYFPVQIIQYGAK